MTRHRDHLVLARSPAPAVAAGVAAAPAVVSAERRWEADVAQPVDDERADAAGDCKFELKLGGELQGALAKKADARVAATAGSSSGSHACGGDAGLDKQELKTTAIASRAGRLEAKIKSLANYLKSVSAGVRRRGVAFDSTRLGQAYYRRSVPAASAARTKLNAIVSRHSSVEHQTTLSWEDAAEACRGSYGDLNEVMTATPRSRKRGRPSEIFCDGELRQICHRCDVPLQHVDRVMRVIKSTFGTPELDVIALEEFVPGNVVVFVGMLIFESIDCGEDLVDLRAMPSFLRHVQGRYDRDMPFHNATHAADVMHTLFMMLWNTSLGQKISLHNQVGALLAAVMHDVEHVGLMNDFLIKTKHPIAQKYPTRAPMESKHTAVALQAVADPAFHVLSKLSAAQREDVLEVVRETITATALIYQPELLAEINSTPLEEWKKTEQSAVLPQPLQVRALRIAMHVSDISQTMKPFANHQKWVFRLNDEHYRQGELDVLEQRRVSPAFCFRDAWTYQLFLEDQVGFLKHVALPAIVAFNVIPWLDANELVNGVELNIAEWQRQQRQSS